MVVLVWLSKHSSVSRRCVRCVGLRGRSGLPSVFTSNVLCRQTTIIYQSHHHCQRAWPHQHLPSPVATTPSTPHASPADTSSSQQHSPPLRRPSPLAAHPHSGCSLLWRLGGHLGVFLGADCCRSCTRHRSPLLGRTWARYGRLQLGQQLGGGAWKLEVGVLCTRGQRTVICEAFPESRPACTRLSSTSKRSPADEAWRG